MVEAASRLKEETQDAPLALQLARSIHEKAPEAGDQELRTCSSRIVNRLEADERRKNRGSIGGGLLVMILLFLFWFLFGPFPMFFMYYITYFNPSLVTEYFPNPSEAANENLQGGADSGQVPGETFFEFLQHSGKIGDVYGGINSFLSAAALAGAIISIFLQGRELTLQRDEMRMTRRQLTRTADAQNKSEMALEAQAKIAGLKHMADFEQQRHDGAETILLRLQAKGRQRAHLARLETVLHTFGQPVREDDTRHWQYQQITEFWNLLSRHRDAYQGVKDDAGNHNNPFGPVVDVMVHLAEDVEWIFALKIGGAFSTYCISIAKDLITDVVEERKIEPALSPEEVRTIQLERCEICFRLLFKAVDAMRHPENFDTPGITADFMKEGATGFPR
jgi:hypothetical protein